MLCSPSSVVDPIEPGVMEFDVVILTRPLRSQSQKRWALLGRARLQLSSAIPSRCPQLARSVGV